MPWKKCSVMDERVRFVARLLDGEKMAALWRRRRDLNPRDPFGSNGFQDRRFQPLTHSSVSKYNAP
jgi:hypothetical protein